MTSPTGCGSSNSATYSSPISSSPRWQRLLASAPGLRIIATSREPLRVAAEVVFQVPPLSTPPAGLLAAADLVRYEAVRLFSDRASAAVPGFSLGPGNAASVSALCRALDGVPLAIELAAAWVRVLSVEQIAARLGGRFQLLTTGDRTAPARHRTLRATIDWSHDLLTSREQLMLRRLSVFAGWSLDMAEDVCSDDKLPADQMLDLITALVDKSLVVVEPEVLGQTRYRMLDTIREYAAEQLAEAGESDERERRLRDYALRVTEDSMAVGMGIVAAPWSARVDVFRRFDIDAGNALQVLSRCLADGDAETGLRICTAIRPCWIVRGTFAEGAEWFDSFLAIDAPGMTAAIRGPALVGRAQLALSSDPAEARRRAEQGLELCRVADDEFWTAAALNLLAEAAIAVMGDIDQQWGVARTLLGLGDLARLRRDPDGARDRYLEALRILREIDSRPEIARCLAGLARVALDQGQLTAARQHLAESIRLSHSAGSRIGVARGLEAFAALAVQAGRPDRAVQLAAAAAALRQAARLPPLAGARAEQYIAPARSLGEHAIQRLWAQGSGMATDDAVALALDFAVSASAANGPAAAANGPAAAANGPAPGAHAGPALPAVLTAREREIAALIAAGYSNRAIAEELVIAPATAARHVANILAKLGFTSRAQVAAWERHGSAVAGHNGSPPAG